MISVSAVCDIDPGHGASMNAFLTGPVSASAQVAYPRQAGGWKEPDRQLKIGTLVVRMIYGASVRNIDDLSVFILDIRLFISSPCLYDKCVFLPDLKCINPGNGSLILYDTRTWISPVLG